MVMDAAIVGACHRTQFSAAVFRLEGIYMLGAVVGQAVLQVDPRQSCGRRWEAGASTMLASGPKAQWVGATGSSAFGSIRCILLRQCQR